MLLFCSSSPDSYQKHVILMLRIRCYYQPVERIMIGGNWKAEDQAWDRFERDTFTGSFVTRNL